MSARCPDSGSTPIQIDDRANRRMPNCIQAVEMANVIPIKDEAQKLSAELSVLTKQQYEALQEASYLNMSPQQAAEYDQRRLRIGNICELLTKFKPIALDSPTG
jgi:hypothetical protein